MRLSLKRHRGAQRALLFANAGILSVGIALRSARNYSRSVLQCGRSKLQVSLGIIDECDLLVSRCRMLR
jgi:hypothetical protein